MVVKWHSSGSQVRSRVVVLTTSFFVRTWQLPLYIYEDFFLHIYIEAIAMFEQKKMCSSGVQLPLENHLNTTLTHLFLFEHGNCLYIEAIAMFKQPETNLSG